MAEERKTVIVGCSNPNGVRINVWEEVDSEFGTKRWRKTGPDIRLNGPSGKFAGANGMAPGTEPGFTELDASWWALWVEQNKGKNALLDTGVIFERKENPTS